MEVSIPIIKGLPTGCLLSVRAGNTRRQAPVPVVEPLRFPSLPYNAKNFKIDVLNTLGSARLDIHGHGDVESHSVPITLATGQEVEVGIQVKEEPSLCGKRAWELKQLDCGTIPAVNSQDPAKDQTLSVSSMDREKLQAANETRLYANEHNIPRIVQEMLQWVLRERPQTPFSEMAAYFARKAEESGEDTVTEADRTRLEAEHLSLRAERARLLRELADLESARLCENLRCVSAASLHDDIRCTRKHGAQDRCAWHPECSLHC